MFVCLGASGRARGVRNTKITLKKKNIGSPETENDDPEGILWPEWCGDAASWCLTSPATQKVDMERTFPWSLVYLQSLSVRTLGVSTKKWANVAVGWVESYHCLPWHVHFAYVRVPPIPQSVDDLTPLPHHLLLPTLFSWPKRGYVEFTFGESFRCTWWPTDDFF